MLTSDDSADQLIDSLGLKQVTDTGAIEAVVEQVMADNAAQVEAYRAAELDKQGKMVGFFVGQVMKVSGGKANHAGSQQNPTSQTGRLTMQHSPGFEAICNAARERTETNIATVKARLDTGEALTLIDVREDREFANNRLPGAVHLGKGVIERDIEGQFPDKDQELILYCGGGFRSALAADNLQIMGYTNVISMDGGVRGWKEAGFELDSTPA